MSGTVARSEIKAALDATDYTRGAAQVDAANRGMVSSGEAVVATTERVEQTTNRGSRSFEAASARLDGAIRATQQYNKDVAALDTALKRGITTQEEYNRLLALAQQRQVALAASAGQVGTTFRGAGHTIQQAGFQLQDFTVQVQAGTSWLTALSQQGSQFLGLFGAGGAMAGVALAIGTVAAQFLGAKDAATALNEALDRQRDLYRTANDNAERYREGRQREAQDVAQLATYYSTLTTEMREAERLRLVAARGQISERQYGRAYGATSEVNNLDAANGLVPGMPLAESMMAGIGGPGQLSANQQRAVSLVNEFHARGVYDPQSIDALSVALERLVRAGGAGSEQVSRLRAQLEAARPSLVESWQEMERNAAQLAALEGNARGAMDALGGLGASIAAQLSPLRSLGDDLAKANAQLAAMRRGGLAGLEAADRALTAQQRIAQDRQEEISRYMGPGEGNGLSLADATARADSTTPMWQRFLAASQYVSSQHEVAEGRRTLTAAERRAESAGRGVSARFGRLGEESEAQAAASERVAQAYLRSVEAGRQAEATEQALAAVRRTGTERTVEQDAAVRRIVDAHQREARALADKQSVLSARKFENERALLEAEVRLIGASAEARERELAAIRARQEIEGRNGDPDSKASRRLIASAESMASARLEADRIRSSFEELQNIGERAFNRIGEAITQAFADGSMKAIDFGNIAKAVLSEIAQDVIKLGLLNPVRNSLLGANLPTLGSVSQAAGMLFSGGGGSGAASGAASGAGGGSWLSGISGIATNPIWQPNGGWFSPAQYGPPAPGEGGVFTTLGSNSLGSYAAGIGGGYMIGSTLGGYLAGNSSARQQNSQIGAASGAAIGAIAGSFIPGIGNVAGALIGGAIGGGAGGLIGPGAAFKGGDVGVGVDGNGFLTITRAGGKNWDGGAARDQTTAQLESLNAILRSSGVTLNGLQGSQLGWQGYGGSKNVFGPTEIWNSVRGNLTSSNPTLNAAFAQPWMQSFEDLSVIAPFSAANDNLTRAIGTGNIRSRDDFNNASTFITQIYEPMVKAASITDTFAESLNNLAKQWGDAIGKATELGLATDTLVAAQRKAVDTAVAQRNTAVHEALVSLSIDELRATGDSGDAQRATRMAFNLSTAQQLRQTQSFLTQNGYGEGTDLYAQTTARLMALFDTQRRQMNQPAEEAAPPGVNSGTALLQDILVGEAGGGSAASRYAAGVGILGNLRRAGDLDAYTSFASRFIGTARNYLGTSERFGQFVGRVRNDTVALGGDPTGMLVDVQTRTADGIDRLTGVTKEEFAALRKEFAKFGAQMVTLQARLTKAA